MRKTADPNLNPYYPVELKLNRLRDLGLQVDENTIEASHGNLTYFRQDITEKGWVRNLMESQGIEAVVHLAAQPGVRYSIDHPEAYIQANVL